jgi:hypothetical protein
MNHRITGIALIALVAALAPTGARAAVSGATVTLNGQPAKWDNAQSITYNIDQKGLSAKIKNSQAAQMVHAAFDAWQNIDTAKLTFEDADPLDRDVTGANISDFLQGLPSDVNPIIFDQDGGVTDAFLGNGASRGTIAFGGILQSTPTGKIAQGIVVINGRAADGLFDPDDVGTPELTRAVARAIGQMLNLGASDLNDDLVFDGNPANNTAVPIMYPATVIGGGIAPTLDDRMSVSALYPSADIDKKTGIIRGQVVLPDGTTGLQGIEVIARKVDDPINSAVSTITGSLFEQSSPPFRGSRDTKLRGAFEMRVPPGNYTIEYRPLALAIGPLQQIFPLPGGPQFYQASSSPTAGPVDPAQATPVTVTAGQPTELTLQSGGTAPAAPQNVAEAEPNDSAFDAQVLPLSAVVTGHVAPNDPAQIVLDTGGGTRDRIEDIYQLRVTQPSIIHLMLEPKDKVDLDLYVFNGFPGGAASAVLGSFSDGTQAEALQINAGPGVYYLGVTAWDNTASPAPTDYTLTVTTTPYTPIQPKPLPVLDRLVVGDITASGATATWVTDIDATGDAVVGMPRQQVGDANAGKSHKVTIANLTDSSFADLIAVSQTPTGGLRDNLPRVFFRTASKTPATGAAKMQATQIGQIADIVQIGDNLENTILVALAIRNTGGDATNVQLTGLAASTGWKLASASTDPIQVGGIASGGAAIVMVRLRRDGTGPAPLAAVTASGTATGSDGAAANFTIGP